MSVSKVGKERKGDGGPGRWVEELAFQFWDVLGCMMETKSSPTTRWDQEGEGQPHISLNQKQLCQLARVAINPIKCADSSLYSPPPKFPQSLRVSLLQGGTVKPSGMIVKISRRAAGRKVLKWFGQEAPDALPLGKGSGWKGRGWNSH